MKRFLSLSIALVLVLSCVPLSIFAQAAASDYISTSYAANLNVVTKVSTALKAEPNNSASAKYTVAANNTLSVQALHKNTSGTYYYEVLYYNTTLYVKATDCQMVSHLTGDVSIANAVSPASLAIGDSFSIKGDITSTKNLIGKVTAGMYLNQNISAAPAVSASATVNAKSYSLYGSTVDSNLKFGSTPAGVYDYAVTVEAISYYIDSNGSLATSSQNVTVERRQCVVTDWRNPNKSTGFGIDVSSWNGSIDWSKAKNDIDFAILRIGFRTKLDSRFLEYAAGCEKYGIPYGVYHYSYAVTGSGAQEEAQWVLDTLKSNGYNPPMGVWFDMEDESQASLSSSTKEEICRGFCDTIRAGGYDVGFYGFLSWFSSSFTHTYLNSLRLWVTQIDSDGTCTHDRGTWLWQYSWEGSVSGISGDVDCNISFANLPKANVSGGDSSFNDCTYYPSYFTGRTTSSLNMRTGPGTSYSVISTLNSGTSIEITGLYQNTYGGYWYQINHNGTTGYVDSGYVTPINYRYDDIAVLSPNMDSNLAVGSPYTITGEITSENNNIYTANAKIYSGTNTQAAPVLSSSDTCNSKSYNLRGSTVDYGLTFGSLSAGYYTYEISADVRNYYVSGGSLQYQEENVVVFTAAFTVGDGSDTPPVTECSHQIVTDAAVAPTCTSAGWTAGSHCSICQEVITAQETIPATGHSYVGGSCTKCGAADPNYQQPATNPTVTPKAPSLTFRDEVTIDVHFAATDLGNLTGANLGLLTWSSARSDGTVLNAESNVRGAAYNSSTGRYMISTPGIPARKLGDTVYMKLYVQMANGNYVYSKLFSYSPKTYATNQLQNSGDAKVKALMVAMLNYAAAAQTYFSYKPYDLANKDLTAAQKSLVSSYSSYMVPSSGSVSAGKAGIFTNSGGFSKKIPAVSFGSAFSIEYFFTPAYTPSGNVTLYYWTQADYNAVGTLTASNASGRMVMTPVGDGSYHCAITGIAAKDLNKTIYVAGGYKSGSTNHCTGVLPYSIGTYCASQFSNATAAKNLAAATAVYGYYANAYFNG